MMVLRPYFENIEIFFKLIKLLHNFPFNSNQIRNLQKRKLKKLLAYAYSHFEFYRNLMDVAGFDPHSFRGLEDLKKIPVIDRGIYRDFVEKAVANASLQYIKRYHIEGTSGSTGMPMKVYRSLGELSHLKALWLRALRLNGYSFFDRTLWILGPNRSVSSDSDSFFQKFGIMARDSVSILETPQNMYKAYINSNPEVLISNKSSLVQLSMYIKKKDVEIQKPKICLCYGETLEANSNRLIREVFGIDRLIDVYAATEFGTLAFQLKGENFLYPCHDSSVIELENNGVINESKGYCIITDLHVSSFPLIRYKLGDWLEMEKKRGLPVIKSVGGRMDDWITWKDGSKIPFRYFYEVIGHRTEIRQFKVIQKEYDKVFVKVVLKSDSEKGKVKKNLVHDLLNEVRNDVVYEIEFVENIPPDPTGKLSMVTSNVN